MIKNNTTKKNEMRDKRFIAEHRGGILKKEQHKQLIKWACDCAENVSLLFGGIIDARLTKALLVAKAWAEENATVGEARKASLNAIAVANESLNPISTAVARAIGHAAATAHMADHSIIAAEYALKAIKLANKSVDAERNWQDKQLSSDISELVITTRNKKQTR